ncbi:GNAT family N-acetyltransferase [Massilia sp. W12]|uniref:GNAT family N-acetyltransferase n=1 Tax=Massilia sp. W12 TaxID=3126507 RepID=UPI0030CD12AA
MSLTSFQLLAADRIPAAELHALACAAFDDYLIPLQLANVNWPSFIARQAINLAHSRIALQNGAPCAFALVAPRQQRASWRLAMMGALPAARGNGAAAALLQDWQARARQAGQAIELEVVCANQRALALYQKHGMRQSHILSGWHAPALGGISAGLPPEILSPSLPEAFAWLEQVERRLDGIPLQTLPACLRPQQEGLQAWRLEHAQIVFRCQGQELLLLSILQDDPQQAAAARLLTLLRAHYPLHSARISLLQRDDLGGLACAEAGFSRHPMQQFLLQGQANEDLSDPSRCAG